MKIIIISPFSPTPVGHGGNHRAYQIFTDLCALIKPSNVVGLNYGDWMNGAYDKLQPSDKRFVTRINRNRQFRKWLTYWKNPQKIFWNITQFSPYRFVYPDYINLYIQEISKNDLPCTYYVAICEICGGILIYEDEGCQLATDDQFLTVLDEIVMVALGRL